MMISFGWCVSVSGNSLLVHTQFHQQMYKAPPFAFLSAVAP
jgi:hypothetical protein